MLGKPVLPTLFLLLVGTCEELFSSTVGLKKRAKLLASSSIKVCLACLLSKMTCAWTMFWLLGLSTVMLSWCAGLIEVLHHRSEGIFFFSNWSNAFILGIKHRQHILLNFSIFIFYYIIFIILSFLCKLFMYKMYFSLFGSPFANKWWK